MDAARTAGILLTWMLHSLVCPKSDRLMHCLKVEASTHSQDATRPVSLQTIVKYWTHLFKRPLLYPWNSIIFHKIQFQYDSFVNYHVHLKLLLQQIISSFNTCWSWFEITRIRESVWLFKNMVVRMSQYINTSIAYNDNKTQAKWMGQCSRYHFKLPSKCARC